MLKQTHIATCKYDIYIYIPVHIGRLSLHTGIAMQWYQTISDAVPVQNYITMLISILTFIICKLFTTKDLKILTLTNWGQLRVQANIQLATLPHSSTSSSRDKHKWQTTTTATDKYVVYHICSNGSTISTK